MQVLLLGLFVALYLHDMTTAVAVPGDDGYLRHIEALPTDTWPYLGPLPVAAIVFVPKLLLLLLYQLTSWQTKRRLGKPGGQRAFALLEKLTAAMPITLLLLFFIDLWAGALRTVRLELQHLVLIDELLVLLPTLFVAAFTWWSYYPVERRLREAIILRLADAGQPMYPVQTRWQYVTMQARHQFGLLLLPLLVIFAWSESLTLLGPDHRGVLSEDTALWLTPAGVLAIFFLSPLVIRHVWQTMPLPPGEVRDRMLALCKHHHVKVRELLLWRTGSGLINAAVTGLLAPVRYILLSDGLLDQIKPREIEAVMAHELAHVKCKHIVWMGLVLITTLGLTELAGHYVIDEYILPTAPTTQESTGQASLLDLNDPQTRTLVVSIPAFTITLMIFGWVSRRIERQADVFAARHLASVNPEPAYDDQARQVFDDEAAQTMVSALQRVAILNHHPVERKSWRHGSIQWRQDHLRSLVGQPINQASIDRVINRVKLATLAGLALLILTSFL